MAKIRRNDPNARMDDAVSRAGVGSDVSKRIPLSQLDREQFPWWIAHLRQAETDIRQLRGQLEGLLAESCRRCPVCGVAVTGRADRGLLRRTL